MVSKHGGRYPTTRRTALGPASRAVAMASSVNLQSDCTRSVCVGVSTCQMDEEASSCLTETSHGLALQKVAARGEL